MSSRSHTSKKWYFPGHDKNTVANILRQKFRIQLEDYDCDRILRLYAYMREFWTDVRNPGSARNIRASVNNIQVSDAYALSYATWSGRKMSRVHPDSTTERVLRRDMGGTADRQNRV